MESKRKRRVLIVDDDGAVQVSLALLLKQHGFEAVCCDDPRWRHWRGQKQRPSTWSCRT
jgi:FixJ family two-component response regulator